MSRKVSKLEELVNVLVSKNNTSNSSRSSNNGQLREQQNARAVWEPYTIPSPLPPAVSYSLAPDEEGDDESHDIDNAEFTDSEDSLYSMRLGVRVDQVDEGNNSPVQRNNNVHWSPQIYNNNFHYSDQEDRGPDRRSSRSRARRNLSPSYNNTFNLDQDNRNREQHRNRSRSPYSTRHHLPSRNRNTSPEYRRPSRRHLTSGGRNEQAIIENANGNTIRQTGESVVVSIGVSENVSSDSSSSASTSASDSD